ncbi:MAG: hypothetical protein IJ829_05725, partial [Kiritimatiellae bacterium]|nr:hypothetical protein [Kiritimatiellia bacterium]
MSKYKNIPPEIAAKLDESVGRVRRIIFLRGVFATLAVCVASVLAIMAVDAMVTIYVSWVRWLLWAAAVAGTCAVAWFALLKPLGRRFSASEIASLIERNHPELEERLSTVVELAQSGDLTSSSRLMEEITKDAVRDAKAVSPRREFTGRTIKPRLVAAAIAVGVLAVLFAAFPRATLRLVTRALMPAAEVDNIYASSLKVSPGDQVLLEGTPLTVSLAVSGGFPSRAFVRTRPDGKGESVERMVRVSEEGAEGPVVYSFSYPRAVRSFSYRLSCGSALTRAYRVEVVPEPTYSGRMVEIHHPAYTGREKEVYTNSAAVVGLAGSKVVVSAKPARSGISGEARLPGDVVVPAEESGDRLRFAFDLAPELAGGWCTVLWDDNGFTNQVDTASISVAKDTPPEVKLVSPDSLDLKLPTSGILPVEFAAKDDFGISRTVLEVCIGAGAWQDYKPVACERAGDLVWVGSHTVRFFPGGFNNAAVLRFRVRAEDNLPAELGGPGVAYTSEIMVNLVGGKGAKSLARQSLGAQIDGAKKDVANILDHLKRAQRGFEQAAKMYASAEKNDWARKEGAKASENGKAAVQNAEGLLADFIEGLLDSRLQTGAEMFKPILDKHVTPIRQGAEDVFLLSRWNEKSASSKSLVDETAAAIKAFEEAQRKFAILTKAAEDLQKMQDLAEREKALAELARQGDIDAKELASEEKKLADEFKDEIKDQLEKNLEKQKEKAKELEEKGKSLEKRQEEIEKKAADAAKKGDTEALKAAANEEEQLAKDIDKLAKEASDLARQIEEKTGTSEMDQNKTSEPADKASDLAKEASEKAKDAAEKMKEGNSDGAKDDMKNVKDALSDAQKQLSSAQEKMEAKESEFADNAKGFNETLDSMNEAIQAAENAAEAQERAEAEGQQQSGDQQQGGEKQQQGGEKQQGDQQQQQGGEKQQGDQQQQQGGEKQQGDQQQQQG